VLIRARRWDQFSKADSFRLLPKSETITLGDNSTSDSLSERTLRDAQRPFGQEGSLPSHDNLAHDLKPETGDSNKGGIKSELPNRVTGPGRFFAKAEDEARSGPACSPKTDPIA